VRFAVLADIHANMAAFEAVLEHIKNQGHVDSIIIAGDHVGDAPMPSAVLNKIKELSGHIILGNRDKDILSYDSGNMDSWNDYIQWAGMKWTYSILNSSDLEYLKSLPEQLSIKVDESFSIRVVHGSPNHIYEHLYIDKYHERLESAVNTINENILICAHTHESWTTYYKGTLIINPGSIGIHYNDKACAEYSILDINDVKCNVEHYYVPYDFNKLINDYTQSGLLETNILAKIILLSLVSGKNFVHDFIKNAYQISADHGIIGQKNIPDEFWNKSSKMWYSSIKNTEYYKKYNFL